MSFGSKKPVVLLTVSVPSLGFSCLLTLFKERRRSALPVLAKHLFVCKGARGHARMGRPCCDSRLSEELVSSSLMMGSFWLIRVWR